MPTPIQRRAINTDLNPNWDAAEHSLRCAMEVIDWCQAEHINLAGLEARDIDTAMGEMPPGHQSPTDFLDMACALAAVRRLHFVVVQPQSVDAEMLAAVTNLLAAFEEERQILVDCSSVNGVVEDADDNEALAKFDAVIQPARAAIAAAQSATQQQSVNADLLAVAQKCEAMLTRQKWHDAGNDPESVLLREARAAIALATGEQP